MIKSNFEDLRHVKSRRENRKLTLRTIADESGVSLGAIHRFSTGKMEGIHTSTLDSLCRYFEVQSISELMEYVPENGGDSES